MKKITSLIMLFLFTLVYSIETGANTVKYNPVSNPAKLQMSFADPDWNGKQVPSGQQCRRQ